MDTSLKIESHDLSISQILQDFYEVPDFQREYVWEQEHVEKMLQDIWDEFHDSDGNLADDTDPRPCF